jgi:hypothetical protein
VDLSLRYPFWNLHMNFAHFDEYFMVATIIYLVQVLETAYCRNAGKGCVHKIQSGRTLPRTLRKWELRAPGCPFFYTSVHMAAFSFFCDLTHLSLVFVPFLFLLILFALSVVIIVVLCISGHCIKNAIHIITDRTFNSVCWFVNCISKCSVCL